MLPGCLLTLAGLAALLVGEIRQLPALRVVAKPLASAGFLLAALGAGALDSTYGRWILAGLALSWVGDVVLLARGSRRLLLAGLGAFLLAHGVYGAGFVVYGLAVPTSLLAVAVLALPAWLVARWLGPHLSVGMRWPVRAYIAVISAMLALAAGTFAAGGHPSIPAGAVAFYLSDLAVARERFVAPGWRNRAWGLPLYYLAQLLLAWSTGA